MFRCFGSFSLCLETDREKANRSAALSLRGSSTRRRATALSRWRAVDDKNGDSLPLCGSPRRRATAFFQWRAVDDKNADSLPLRGSPRRRRTDISLRLSSNLNGKVLCVCRFDSVSPWLWSTAAEVSLGGSPRMAQFNNFHLVCFLLIRFNCFCLSVVRWRDQMAIAMFCGKRHEEASSNKGLQLLLRHGALASLVLNLLLVTSGALACSIGVTCHGLFSFFTRVSRVKKSVSSLSHVLVV
ncbi:hypothetical protein F2Q69_00050818 [Brassica cretica]|uniref:Transmembrane protein n=1 Tax=Brassica cretica TaxID=69181 RepID=A0A8S9PIH6_BRACR|nr:hypothetical protein F2Q69_00050818 [Brassica cretica]